MQSPRHYGFPVGEDREKLISRLQDLIMRSLNEMARNGLDWIGGRDKVDTGFGVPPWSSEFYFKVIIIQFNISTPGASSLFCFLAQFVLIHRAFLIKKGGPKKEEIFGDQQRKS